LRELPRTRLEKISRLYNTVPQYVKNQPRFINAAVRLATALKPPALLAALKHIEYAMGRRPGRRFGPRIIDVDILLYGSRIIKKRNLIIPHPRMQERLFVLQPLAEIAPHAKHPILKKRISALLKELAL
jgi:2-amino-4-hydroxy-6-hydroxymethyldihydropteridine diphosphokinase